MLHFGKHRRDRNGCGKPHSQPPLKTSGTFAVELPKSVIKVEENRGRLNEE